jgi:hypothetical protein
MKLNEAGYDNARRLVDDDHVVLDERDDWSEHHPTTGGGGEPLHRGARVPASARCAVLAAESGAGQYKHLDIEHAVAHLHGMLDALARA